MRKRMQLTAALAVALLTIQPCSVRAPAAGADRRTGDGEPGVVPREWVRKAIDADLPPDQLMARLEPYINIGRTRADIETLLGRANLVFGHGPGCADAYYEKWRLEIW